MSSDLRRSLDGAPGAAGGVLVVDKGVGAGDSSPPGDVAKAVLRHKARGDSHDQ